MENKKSVYERLGLIQSKLEVAKTRNNEFGEFDYRNAEDILKALKPFLAEHHCLVVMGEELVAMNGQTYVKSTATLIAYDLTENNQLSNSAYAREAGQRPKMDVAQLTGSATSYARKYALGGLFAIDDGRDADSMNNSDITYNKADFHKKKFKKATDDYKSKRGDQRIDFAEVRKKLESIDNVNNLNRYWLKLSPSDSQAKFLQRDFARRKAVIDGME